MKAKQYLTLLALIPMAASAQQIRSNYVDWGTKGTEFPAALEKWEKGQKWSDDDNFFISRVKPKQRFRNTATQINPNFTDENDKKLIYWVPINSESFNALPDGSFDSEVFPMWSYVTHYGNWSTTLVRVPAGFIDVAHKNGVAVSCVASVPWGNISQAWYNSLTKLVEVGAEKLTDFLLYYGVDGIGYNSEFACDMNLVTGLSNLHSDAVRIMKPVNPLTEFIWYDGTNATGNITFDRGLGRHNKEVWGYGDNVRTSLFFNYNWNSQSLLENSVATAEACKRSPLDLYCGINMQGREPNNANPSVWPLLVKYPLSIGLWGAHSESMLYEGRGEQGSSPEKRMRTYIKRAEKWFTGHTRNPITTPRVNNSIDYSSENTSFFGMSKLMSARSALKWDLSEEPFISYFNLGNGKFFNYKGVRQHDSEWFNIAMQDYLPTWAWWFSSKFLGRNASDVPLKGLDAEYVWDDAWMGGSTVRVFGTSDDEFLHLFKTEFALQKGDEVTFRYKLVNGSATGFIAMSLKGAEDQPVSQTDMKFMGGGETPAPGMWVEKTFTVGDEIRIPAGSEVAMIALHFRNADNLDIRLGEFSIKRPSAMKAAVATPVIEKSEVLCARHNGFDGKIIFNMPNNKGNEVCYNTDVNTSLFKIYAQQEGGNPVLMGMTTSWAALVYSAPFASDGNMRVRFGVSALALNHENESPIAWGEYQAISNVLEYSDEIAISKSVIKPGESFTAGYADPLHETASWQITDGKGNVVKTASNAAGITASLPEAGLYNLIVDGMEAGTDGRVRATRELKGFIQISEESTGDVPQITGVTASNSVSGDGVSTPFLFDKTEALLSYEAATGNAALSRGVRIGDNAVGFESQGSSVDGKKSFSVSFWFKPESFKSKSIHMLNIRYKGDPWAVNHWGWFWHTLTENGNSDAFTIRMANDKNASYRFDGMRLIPGVWQHITYVFEMNDEGKVRPALFVNGERQAITSWSLGDAVQSGDPQFVGLPWGWKNTFTIAVGGYLHKTGSVRGNVDNLMVWDKALDEEGVKAAMGDFDPANIPAELTGYFTFEDEPGTKGMFANHGSSDFKAGIINYEETEVEGQGKLQWRTPEFCTGCPFVKGDAFKLTSKATWLTPGGVVKESTDNADGGTAKLEYNNHSLVSLFPDGFPVRLTLSNEYGEDSRDMLLQFKHTGLEEVVGAPATLSVAPSPFETEITVTAPEEGQLTVSLFTLDGRRLLANSFNAAAGEGLKVYPSVESGLYLLTVESEGRLLGTAKVVRR